MIDILAFYIIWLYYDNWSHKNTLIKKNIVNIILNIKNLDTPLISSRKFYILFQEKHKHKRICNVNNKIFCEDLNYISLNLKLEIHKINLLPKIYDLNTNWVPYTRLKGIEKPKPLYYQPKLFNYVQLFNYYNFNPPYEFSKESLKINSYKKIFATPYDYYHTYSNVDEGEYAIQLRDYYKSIDTFMTRTILCIKDINYKNPSFITGNDTHQYVIIIGYNNKWDFWLKQAISEYKENLLKDTLISQVYSTDEIIKNKLCWGLNIVKLYEEFLVTFIGDKYHNTFLIIALNSRSYQTFYNKLLYNYLILIIWNENNLK